MLLILFFTIAITYLDLTHQTRSRWLDFSLFFITGFIGVFFLFLWIGTQHSGTPYNLNVLWAFPTNAVVAFYMLKEELPTGNDVEGGCIHMNETVWEFDEDGCVVNSIAFKRFCCCSSILALAVLMFCCILFYFGFVFVVSLN